MNFEIINNKGVYEIHGDFINDHTNKVETYFNNLLDTYYEVVISLKKVNKIDNKALEVMRFISEKAKRRSKVLFVLGKGNKRIKTEFKKANLNTIFKNDYDKQ